MGIEKDIKDYNKSEMVCAIIFWTLLIISLAVLLKGLFSGTLDNLEVIIGSGYTLLIGMGMILTEIIFVGTIITIFLPDTKDKEIKKRKEKEFKLKYPEHLADLKIDELGCELTLKRIKESIKKYEKKIKVKGK